jgi:hypothetical protein
MRLIIDNTTRFFAVVGAPYLPEDHDQNDVRRIDARHRTHELAGLPPFVSAGAWLAGDH